MSELSTLQGPLPGQLLIVSTSENGVSTLALSGELDLASTRVFDERLVEVEATRPAKVVVDLGAVSFMDSTGLQALLRARERARGNSYRLVLRRGPNQVQRVFELTRTDTAFEFES
jgi:anti-anti-sigma factor